MRHSSFPFVWLEMGLQNSTTINHNKKLQSTILLCFIAHIMLDHLLYFIYSITKPRKFICQKCGLISQVTSSSPIWWWAGVGGTEGEEQRNQTQKVSGLRGSSGWDSDFLVHIFFFFLIFFLMLFLPAYILFIYVCMYVCMYGFGFCARAFFSCGKRGPLFIAVRGPLTIAASPAAEHRLQTRRLSNCGSRAEPPRGMWDPPRPGLEPACPALAGRFSTTAPPGKPPWYTFEWSFRRMTGFDLQNLLIVYILVLDSGYLP